MSHPRLAALGGSALLAVSLSAIDASAAPAWVDRPQTIPRLVFAGDVGVGLGHAGPLVGNPTGAGMNFEAGFGILENLDVGLRMGLRLGDDARAVALAGTGPDAYARTIWTETWGTNIDTFANPEARVRWSFYRGSIVEVGLDGRAFIPVEDGSRFGTMPGLPLTIHAGSILRIDTGAYVPIVFYNDVFHAFSFPAYFWFQPTERFWLGPMMGLRFINPPGPPDYNTEFLLGFGLGYQVASMIDLKTQVFFPRINETEGGRYVGAGFGLQFRIGE